jgi:predicted ATP-grasp superfamily ATP-dependent carboligase
MAAGVPTPRTHYPRSVEELTHIDYAYPVLVKPACRDGFNRLTHQKGWLANDWSQLLARYREALTLVPPDVVMVQELIPGGGEAQFSFAGLCLDGQPIAYALARRTRQFPPLIGRSSSYVETVEAPEVEKLGTALVRQMRFTGLIEIEFKHDARDGDFKVLDINPRVWGWHTLGRSVGLDFAYLAWQLANGLPVAAHRVSPGLCWVRGTTDVPTALALICSGRLSPAAYWRSRRRPVERAVFAVDDPMPGLVELPLFLALAARRGAL